MPYKCGVKYATRAVALAFLLALVLAIIWLAKNADDLSGVWRPHNIVWFAMALAMLPICFILGPLAGVCQALCAWREVDEQHHPNLSACQRAAIGAKSGLQVAALTMGAMVSCGQCMDDSIIQCLKYKKAVDVENGNMPTQPPEAATAAPKPEDVV